MKKWTVLFYTFIFHSCLCGQYPGAAGIMGSTAIFKDSNIFNAWASSCALKRGPMDIANPSNGDATLGDAQAALGEPGANGIVSLGDGGQAVLSFEQPIKNGPGADFAIFENSFSDFFLELAFVEVSSDSQRWVRFPAHCLLSQSQQIGPFDDSSDPTKLNNLAGKYRGQYGTPFDLEELNDSAGLNLDSIVFIKIIDCVGSLNPQYATYDTAGNAINDPYATPFASSGFDLDAVGVIHQNVVNYSSINSEAKMKLYPNPLSRGSMITLDSPTEIQEVQIISSLGKLIFKSEDVIYGTSPILIRVPDLQGVYFIKVKFVDGWISKKLLIK